MTKRLTDKSIAAIKPPVGDKRLTIKDPELPGHYIRIQANGKRSYAVVTRDPRGKQVWATLGDTSLFGIDEARERGRAAIMAIKAGRDASGPQSFEAVAALWVKRHVEAKDRAHRTAKETARYLAKHILPTWGGREFTSIRRGDVAKLLDRVEDTAGPVAADKVLSHLSSIFNWYAARHDDFESPIIRGMRRSAPAARARKRILADDEIRAVWQAAEGRFGGIVKLLLLTGQRREKVSGMRWDELDLHAGTWTLTAEAREKGNAGVLQLPQAAWNVISAQPMVGDSPYVFAGKSKGHYMGFGRAKADLDAKSGIAEWRLHDLRRTARSLMSRAGVQPHVAERTIGHAIAEVEGIYDRHAYTAEKAEALQRLAGLVDSILTPRENVVPLRKA